jgi:hypothetical protein
MQGDSTGLKHLSILLFERTKAANTGQKELPKSQHANGSAY